MNARVIRVARALAIWAVALIVLCATGVALAESYDGLFLWFSSHGVTGIWADLAPAMVDSFTVVGELALFIGMAGHWDAHSRALPWTSALGGLALSTAGNVGHVAGHPLSWEITAAIPPLAGAAAIGVGLGVLKRLARESRQGETISVTTPPVTEVQVERPAELTELPPVDETSEPSEGWVELADEDRLEPAPGASVEPLASLSLVPVPASSEHAARIAYEASVRGGNPLSTNALQARFGLTRTQATRVRNGGNGAVTSTQTTHLPAQVA